MKKHSFGIRNKLILIFIIIKVVPLIVLAWFSWHEISKLADKVQHHFQEAISESRVVTEKVVDLATENSIRALDLKSREAIERLTTDTARQVASFLFARDSDIEMASSLAITEELFQQFLATRYRYETEHHPMVMDVKGEVWQFSEEESVVHPSFSTITEQNRDNEKDFHARPQEHVGILVKRPLYLEMTFVDLSGLEKVKTTTSSLVSSELRDVSKKENTYCRAETYFQHLEKLAPGEIYVSDVIGAYRKTHMIGLYSKKRAEKMGIAFEPELSAYGGRENPVGKRFQGLIRWATPVMRDGKKIGYITLALDHSHVMEFTDHIAPTEQRYLEISDASSGNYAFMWDYKSRNISHPRDYYIVGYDPETGEEALPWLEKEHYYSWLKSGNLPSEYLATLPLFHNQNLEKEPAKEQIESGLVALDCRYLNFAPQCGGWNNLTQDGGSGSFLIYWSGLWKLTTAATIPYYTGQYGQSSRGFGFVTIGANVKEFHKAADATTKIIENVEEAHLLNLEEQKKKNNDILISSVRKTVKDLSIYTGIMIVLVITIAFWIASQLTGRITQIISSIHRFQKGDMDHRLHFRSKDEIEDLAITFNEMADNIQESIVDTEKNSELSVSMNIRLQEEIVERRNVEVALAEHRDNLEELVSARTLELEQEIVERKQAEKTKLELEVRLHRAEKMEAIGTLAGGVAHDLNNTLSGVVTYPELLLMSVTKEDPMYIPLQTIKKSGEKAAAIVHDLLTLSCRGVAVTDIIQFNDIVLEYLDSSEYRTLAVLNQGITVDFDMATDLLPILGSRVNLLKMLMNLVNNSVESMAGGGRLTVTTCNHYLDESLGLYEEILEGEYITLSIVDTGVGIPEKDLARIFEPFFTKKEMGRSGTGLGMAVVWGTLKDHNGYIDCHSHIDGGTVFTLYFPVCRDEAIAEKISSDFSAIAGNGEKILLVDDIPEQLEVASMILNHLNYRVYTAASGEEAVAFMEDNKVDLLVLDMIMDPGMDGLDMYRKIIEKHPGQRAIIASGYSETDRTREIMRLGVKVYLKKPYSVSNLGYCVKEGLWG